MATEQSRHQDLPITMAVAANPSTHALHLSINLLSLFLGALTTHSVHDDSIAALLDVFALSILRVFGALLATSLLWPSATALEALLDGATVLSVASTLASLVAVLLRPRLGWAAYSLCMAYTLALLVLRGGDWTNTLHCSLGTSRALPWVRRRVDAMREWLQVHVTTQPDTEAA